MSDGPADGGARAAELPARLVEPRLDALCQPPRPPVRGFQVGGDNGDNRLPTLGGSHEGLVGDFICHRSVAGVPDACPDGKARPGDGAGNQLGVEGRQIALCPAPSHKDDQLGFEGLEAREGS